MAYELDWKTPGSILYLRLIDEVSMQDFVTINEYINQHLDQIDTNDNRTVLVVDMLDAEWVPRQVAHLKASQTYANRQELKWLLVVGTNKYVRLMLLLTFNLSPIRLHFFDDYDHLDQFLERMEYSKK